MNTKDELHNRPAYGAGEEDTEVDSPILGVGFAELLKQRLGGKVSTIKITAVTNSDDEVEEVEAVIIPLDNLD